jgi:hypothetical protein
MARSWLAPWNAPCVSKCDIGVNERQHAYLRNCQLFELATEGRFGTPSFSALFAKKMGKRATVQSPNEK